MKYPAHIAAGVCSWLVFFVLAPGAWGQGDRESPVGTGRSSAFGSSDTSTGNRSPVLRLPQVEDAVGGNRPRAGAAAEPMAAGPQAHVPTGPSPQVAMDYWRMAAQPGADVTPMQGADANAYRNIQYSTPPVGNPQPVSQDIYPGGSWSTSRYAGGLGMGDGTCGPNGCGPSDTQVTLPQAPPTGFFFRWDRLWTTIDAPTTTVLGSATASGVFISNGITYPFINSLSSDYIDEDPEFGDRIEFGFMDPERRGGWSGSILLLDQTKQVDLPGGTIQLNDPVGVLLGFADGNGDNIDDDLNGDNIYGRNGQDLGTPDGLGGFAPPFDGIPDTPAPQDNGDLVRWVPIFDNLSARNYVSISGLELARTRAIGNFAEESHWLQGFYWSLGVRYLDLDERFRLRATGSFYDETNIATSIENFIIGPQVGLGYQRTFGGWELGGSLRFLPGVNLQRGTQQGTIASNADDTSTGRNEPLNLNPMAFATVQDSTEFAPVLEWRADATYALTRHLGLRVGYTGWFMGGISRASTSIDYTLPTFGFDLDNDDQIIAHALTLGAEFRY